DGGSRRLHGRPWGARRPGPRRQGDGGRRPRRRRDRASMKQRFRTSGGELAYVDEGDGPAVVLLHGFPTSSYLWRSFVPPLAARFRVIAPDLLGYGDSAKPVGTDLSMTAQAGYVRE